MKHNRTLVIAIQIDNTTSYRQAMAEIGMGIDGDVRKLGSKANGFGGGPGYEYDYDLFPCEPMLASVFDYMEKE